MRSSIAGATASPTMAFTAEPPTHISRDASPAASTMADATASGMNIGGTGCGRFTGRAHSEVRSVQPMHLRLGAVVVGLAALAFAWSKGRA